MSWSFNVIGTAANVVEHAKQYQAQQVKLASANEDAIRFKAFDLIYAVAGGFHEPDQVLEVGAAGSTLIRDGEPERNSVTVSIKNAA